MCCYVIVGALLLVKYVLCCAIGQVCYVITIVSKKHFKDLFLFSYNSYHLHTLEMTKGNKTMKERTLKTTNHLHTQEMTKGSKIIIEKKHNDEEHGEGGGGVGIWPCSFKKKGDNEKEGNNNQVIHCCYRFMHIRKERGEQDHKGGNTNKLCNHQNINMYFT
jgi:hypothetical protein